MKPKEIFEAAIRLEPTERVPVTLLSGGVWIYAQEGKSLQDSFDMTPEESARYTIEAQKRTRSDLVWCSAGCNNLVLRAVGAQCNFAKVGASASVDEPLLAAPGDIDKLDFDKIPEDPGIQAMLESTRILKREIGDEVMLGISQWGPLTLAGLLLGTDVFMKLLIKDKAAAHAMLEATCELVVRYWDLFLDAGAQYISQAEPSASGDMISRRQFEAYAMPYLTRTFTMIGDKPFAKQIHICGDTSKFMELIPETGCTAMSFDYKVPLAQAREVLGGKIAFLGQMDPVEIMALGTPEQVREDTLRCCRDASAELGGFLLMPGCDIPPTVPLANIEAMVDAAYSYKGN